MKRSIQAIVCAVGVALLAPAAAAAQTTEIGTTATPLAVPVCPSSLPKAECTIILTETTALETASDGTLYPTKIKSAGNIVAYTLGLAKLGKADITTLDAAYGGPPEVELAVLIPGPKRTYKVRAISKPNLIQPWFGQVTQWPLNQTLPVRKGDVLALTVPTWAPVLSINMLPKKNFQYRASRTTGCSLASTFSTETAQETVNNSKSYLCFYTATRVEYTATEVTSPPIPKGAVK